MPELPPDCQDIIALADWLELLALESPDGNSSTGDLKNALQLALGQEKAANLSRDVMWELND